jgi:phage protein D
MPQQPNQSAFATDVDILFDGADVPDAEVVSFVADLDFGQPDMAVITLRNDSHAHTTARNHSQTVEIKAGGAEEGSPKTTIFKGEIVAMEPTYRAQGDSRVMIRALSKMHRMLRAKKSKTFQSMSDQDIVSQLVGPYGLSAQCGSSPKITHEHLYQHNQSDLEFIRVRAARLGFEVWCEDTKLYFDKPKLDVDSGIVLDIHEPGEHHLKTFAARLTSANVLKKVTVRGWDPTKKQEIVGEESAQSSPLGSSNAVSASGDLGKSETFTVDHPIFSVDEAKAIAKAKLDAGNMTYITGEAECRGNGAYKPGIVVTLKLHSEDDYRFNGKYLVRGVTHKYTHGTGGNASGGFVSVLRLGRDAEKP